MKNPITNSDTSVLIPPVTNPAILRPRLPIFLLRAIIAMIIAGIPKKNPNPVKDKMPHIMEATGRSLRGGWLMIVEGVGRGDGIRYSLADFISRERGVGMNSSTVCTNSVKYIFIGLL